MMLKELSKDNKIKLTAYWFRNY